MRLSPATASARSLPDCSSGATDTWSMKNGSTWPLETSVRPAMEALVGHAGQLDAGGLREQLAGQPRGGAEWPKVSLPGAALAAAMNSASVLYGLVPLMLTTLLVRATVHIGRKVLVRVELHRLLHQRVEHGIELLVNISVWPSAGALSTHGADQAFRAGLLSTTTLALPVGQRLREVARQFTSTTVPAPKGTTRVIGLSGKACAVSAQAASAAAVSQVERVRGTVGLLS